MKSCCGQCIIKCVLIKSFVYTVYCLHNCNNINITEKKLPRQICRIFFWTFPTYFFSDSSFEYPSPYNLGDNVDYSNGLKPMKPFGMDLDVTSNRSSTISQVNLHMLQDFSAWENASYKTLGHFEHSYCLTVTASREAELYLLFINHLTTTYFPSLLFL